MSTHTTDNEHEPTEHEPTEPRPRSRRRRAIAGAAAAAAAVAGVASFLAWRSSDEPASMRSTPRPLGEPAELGESDAGFVALTGDGELRRYDADGSDEGLIVDTGWAIGSNFSRPTFDVTSDGEVVYLSRAVTDPSCARAEQLGSEIVRVPVEGGEPEVVAEVGEAPALSPDGDELAYVSREVDGDPCAPNATNELVVLDLQRGDTTELGTDDLPERSTPGSGTLAYTFRPAGVLQWAPDGETLLTNVGCIVPECEAFLTTLVSPDTGEVRYLRQWGEGFDGPAATFSGSGEELAVFLDTSDAGAETRIGLADPDGSDDEPTGDEARRRPERDAVTVPGYIVVPDATGILSLDALSSEDAPGILAVVQERGAGRDHGIAYAYTQGQQSVPVPLAEGVVAAEWLAGTTFDDVPAPETTTVAEPVARGDRLRHRGPFSSGAGQG